MVQRSNTRCVNSLTIVIHGNLLFICYILLFANILTLRLQGGQSENSPYICYTPSYGYAQSPYNPYNPYIPGASVGVDSFVGFQQYYSSASYDNAASSPTYVPYVIQPDMVSNSSTDSLVATDLANGGRSDERGSRQKNGSAIAGFPKDAPKSSTVNSLGRTYEKLRSSTGQNKQPGISKNVSTPASAHSLQVISRIK